MCVCVCVQCQTEIGSGWASSLGALKPESIYSNRHVTTTEGLSLWIWQPTGGELEREREPRCVYASLSLGLY